MRARNGYGLLLSAAALAAAPGDAQVVGMAGPIMTDLIIVDRPTLIIDEGLFEQALRRSGDVDAVARDANSQGAVRGAATDAFRLGAINIIEETLGLDQIPALRFDTLGNKAAAEQDGNRNAVTIDQEFSDAAWAVGNQLGEDNFIDVRQIDTAEAGPFSVNRAYVGQVSFAVSSGMPQFSQTAIIRQTHRVIAGNTRSNNAAVQQGGIRAVDAADFSVVRTAIGENNIARIEQEGADNDGLVQQGAEDARVFAVEFGDTIGRNNRATLTQIGIGNRAVISQEDDSNAIVRQQGFDHVALVQQDGDVDASAQYSRIEQGSLEEDTHGNFAAVLQRGLGQESEIFQFSNENSAFVEQSPTAAYAQSLIRQTGGSGNYASVLQDNAGGLVTAAVASTILQDGNNNEAYVSQRIDGSRSFISQTGDRNLARVRQ